MFRWQILGVAALAALAALAAPTLADSAGQFDDANVAIETPPAVSIVRLGRVGAATQPTMAIAVKGSPPVDGALPRRGRRYLWTQAVGVRRIRNRRWKCAWGPRRDGIDVFATAISGTEVGGIPIAVLGGFFREQFPMHPSVAHPGG